MDDLVQFASLALIFILGATQAFFLLQVGEGRGGKRGEGCAGLLFLLQVRWGAADTLCAAA